WLAYTCGMDIETVAGKLMITLLSAVGCHTSSTWLQISSAKSISVPVKLSGEYWNWKLPSVCAAHSRNSLAPFTAMSIISCFDLRKTCSRWATEVELYKWTTAFCAPLSDSNVLRIMCSRDWVSTWIVTSSGMRSCSINIRRKVNSVSEAAGKPTSNSL